MTLATDHEIADGEIISVGQHTLKAHYAPGHIDDMICFAVIGGNDIIVGDTLFAGGPGNTRSSAAFQTTLPQAEKEKR